MNRGEIWLADLGYIGKTRPVMILSVPPGDEDRALVTYVKRMNACRATGEQSALAVVWRKHSTKDEPECQKYLPDPNGTWLRAIFVAEGLPLPRPEHWRSLRTQGLPLLAAREAVPLRPPNHAPFGSGKSFRHLGRALYGAEMPLDIDILLTLG